MSSHHLDDILCRAFCDGDNRTLLAIALWLVPDADPETVEYLINKHG